MSQPQSILIIEDNHPELEGYLTLARSLGLARVKGANGVSEALSLLAKENYDFVLTDIFLSDAQGEPGGLSILKYLRDEQPSTTALGMSSSPDAIVYEKALTLGAQHFVRKPLKSRDELAVALDLALERRRLQGLERRQRDAGVTQLPLDIRQACPEGIVISPKHIRLAERACRSPSVPVVLYGETGTGKEEIAKLIYRRRCSAEASIPLVTVNCANLSEGLLESALFGHKRGSFSGANETTTGYVGEANGGILFLDEIHTLSVTCQQKLLRVLNDGSYQRLGDTRALHSNFQVIAASTRSLDDEVERGRFVLDLRTRLTGIDITLAPLRDRLGDLPLLVSLFFAKAGVAVAAAEIAKTVDRCRNYYWRGNIRQLFMVLNLMVATAKDLEGPVLAAYLPEFPTMFPPGTVHNLPQTRKPFGSEGTPFGQTGDEGAAVTFTPKTYSTPKENPQGVSNEMNWALEQAHKALQEDVPFCDAVESFEKSVLQFALQRHGNNISHVCLALRMPRSSFELKRKKFTLR